MPESIFKRTTFIVPDAAAAAQFYIDVFGWRIWYDNELPVDGRFPPAAPDGALAHLILVQVEDPNIGMLGFLEYKDPRLETRIDKSRERVVMGDTVLVIETTDIAGCYERAKSTGASITSPPADWEVPSHDGKGAIKLRTMALFDPNGVYIEVNEKR